MAKEFDYDLDCTNLDVMTPDELCEFATHLATLLEFARTKRQAMVLRVEGKVTYALTLEEHCDALYSVLPKNWQW